MRFIQKFCNLMDTVTVILARYPRQFTEILFVIQVSRNITSLLCVRNRQGNNSSNQDIILFLYRRYQLSTFVLNDLYLIIYNVSYIFTIDTPVYLH